MRSRNRFVLLAAGVLLGAALLGCGDLLNIINPDFLTAVSSGSSVSSLPGDAPGIVVWVENRTSRWIRAVVSYRDGENNVRNFTAQVAPGDKTGQMVVCPVVEITLGNVAALDEPGAIVFLADNAGSAANLDDLPFIEVDPFGVLLREDLNYECGDGMTFSVRETPGETRSGYRTRVEISLAGN